MDTTSSESSRESRMDPTVPPRSRRRYQRQPTRFAVYAAPSVGLRPLAVEAAIFGRDPIQHRFAAFVRAALHLGDAAMYARLMGPVEAARADIPALPLDSTLIRTATAADHREDQSRTAFLLELATNPAGTKDELERWLADLDVAMGRMVELRAAIVARLGDFSC